MLKYQWLQHYHQLSIAINQTQHYISSYQKDNVGDGIVLEEEMALLSKLLSVVNARLAKNHDDNFKTDIPPNYNTPMDPVVYVDNYEDWLNEMKNRFGETYTEDGQDERFPL
jgi:hypothetical protein